MQQTARAQLVVDVAGQCHYFKFCRKMHDADDNSTYAVQPLTSSAWPFLSVNIVDCSLGSSM